MSCSCHWEVGTSNFLTSHHLTKPSSLVVITSVPVLLEVHTRQWTGSVWAEERGAELEMRERLEVLRSQQETCPL